MGKHAADVFKLKIGGTDAAGYTVDLVYAPCGERRHPLALPFDAAARRALLELLQPGGTQAARLADDERAALQAAGLLEDNRLPGGESLLERTGRLLYQALFPPGEDDDEDIRGALRQALHDLQPLPCQLQFDARSAGLAGLPWELVWDDEGPLVAGGRLHFTRYIAFGKPTPHFPIVDRLSVLVVAPRPPDAAELRPDAELQRIHTALAELERRGLIRVQTLQPRTLEELARAVNRRPYHILHFDGHGGIVRRCPHCDRLQPGLADRCSLCGTPFGAAEAQGCLAFESADGNPQGRLVTAGELATVLAGSSIRLCVISACHSTTLVGANVFNSAGPKLIEAGVPAVVGMQFWVPEPQAAAFVDEFYTAVAAGQSIAAAAAAGRRLLAATGLWYIPTTYLRDADGEGHLFRFHDTRPLRRQGTLTVDAHGTGVYLLPAGVRDHDWSQDLPLPARPYRRLAPFAVRDKALFFGRSAEIDDLLGAVVAAGDRCTVLLGAAGVGKTSLVNAGLIPQLLLDGYLVLSVREYGDPLELLRQAVAACGELGIDPAALAAALDLPSLVDLLLAETGRPLLIVFDEFEEFLQHSPYAALQPFVDGVARCSAVRYPLPISLLFVLRQDLQSQLGVFQERVPAIFARPVLLKPLPSEEAEAAITRPLGVCDLPVTYDVQFLCRTLLPDLATGTGGTAGADGTPLDDAGRLVNPTYLQIVCAELLAAALPAVTNLPPNTTYCIDAALYAPRRSAAVLNSFLDGRLAEHFPAPAALQGARTLLQQFVTAGGERRFLNEEELLRRSRLPPGQFAPIFALLAGDGLLEVRALPGRPAEYSVGHRFLAEQVRAWFDPAAALRLCAQDALNQSLQRWQTEWRLHARPPNSPGPDVRESLIGPDFLADIRAAREGSQQAGTDDRPLEITPVHFCLLLRSAVYVRHDMEYWARALQKDPAARALLQQMQAAGESDGTLEEDVALGAAALGLPAGDCEPGRLARAAVSGTTGEIRHTAALALAALGVEVVEEALPALAAARPRLHPERPVQALAQMRASGFALPELSLGQHMAASWWAAAIKASDNRLQIFMESACAGLGAGFGLGLAYALLAVLLPWIYSPRFAAALAIFLQPLGVLAGLLAVIVAWLAAMAGRTSSRTRRGLGICAGFLLAVTACWLPFALADSLVQGPVGGFDTQRLLATAVQFIGGGLLWSLGIALGFLLAARLPLHRWTIFWHALLGGAGGAAGCLAAILLGIGIPFVDYVRNPLDPYIAAAVFGFAVGAGLAGGWACGTRIYCRFRGAPTSSSIQSVPKGGAA